MIFLLFGFAEFNKQAYEPKVIEGTNGLIWLAILGVFLLGYFFGVLYTQNKHLFKSYLIKKLDLSDSKFARRNFDEDTLKVIRKYKGIKNAKRKL